MGKSLAEVHALERARWDALVPARFDPSSHASEHRGRDSLTAHLLAAVSDFLGELRGRRVVEYGCGLGDLTLRLAREGAHVTAVDLSPRSIEYVRRRAHDAGVAANIETHVAAAERLPFFDESFDLALGHAVLRCVVSELGAPELHRILRPGGRAVLSEPLGMRAMLSFLPHLTRSPDAQRGAERPWLPRQELERWTAGFSHSEVRFLQLPAELQPGNPDVWRRMHASLLERLPRLRRSRRHAALLLIR
jgi:ubiquinone/menaquinone biosynthesis C-methylase UbiE